MLMKDRYYLFANDAQTLNLNLKRSLEFQLQKDLCLIHLQNRTHQLKLFELF